MKIKLLLTLFCIGLTPFLQAQTVDEIINKYIENSGGKAKLAALQGVKLSVKLNQQGMEIPLTIVQMKDGRQLTSVTFQGKELKQDVFDGTTLWSTQWTTMKAEKSDAETTENFKANLGSDFPIPFFNYKERGYKAELLGKETVEGSDTYKIKLTKNPITVDGIKTDNIEYYFFDVDNFVPILVESEIKRGQFKGMIGQTTLSDYQEIGGFVFPFSMSQGIKGTGASQPLTITSVELDPKVTAADFALPADN